MKINAWEYYIEFYWIDWEKEIFLKKSRKIILSSEYVNNIWKVKKKWRKKKIQKLKKINLNTKKIHFENFKTSSKIYFNFFDFKAFILNFLIWLSAVLFLFLILFKRKVLQKN
jgi:hypothetical protein